ncbi:MAG: tetratricopeptide repeat protein [Gemmatimonadales bacterium]|nr:MAG: tetratricopeptide repeat protein [Gemmatimonadales bacterium]
MIPPDRSLRQRFLAEVSQADEEINLARAAMMVAREEYPQVCEERYLGHLDLLAEETRDRLDEENAHLLVLQELLNSLYGRQRFRGNREAYYDPRNSFLNDVLDRGLGIPLTLGIVVLEVGWRLGLPLEGVNFPGHFLVRFKGDAIDLLIDPYDGGAVRFEDEAQELLDRVYGGMVRVQDSFLKAASKREMLVRLLMNLKSVYLNARDHPRALSAVERILLIRPIAVGEIRDRGVILAKLGRKDEALEQLEAYLNVAPEAADSQRILGMVEKLKNGSGREE